MIRHFSVTRFCARLFLFRRAINDSLIIIIIIDISVLDHRHLILHNIYGLDEGSSVATPWVFSQELGIFDPILGSGIFSRGPWVFLRRLKSAWIFLMFFPGLEKI